jgi:hypothetical protein
MRTIIYGLISLGSTCIDVRPNWKRSSHSLAVALPFTRAGVNFQRRAAASAFSAK